MTTKEMLEKALKDLKVDVAVRYGDRSWSVADLATDLAPFVEKFITDIAMNVGKASSIAP